MSPYREGYDNGRADWLLGQQNQYAWNCALDYSNTYSLEYGRGYQAGWYDARAEYRNGQQSMAQF